MIQTISLAFLMALPASLAHAAEQGVTDGEIVVGTAQVLSAEGSPIQSSQNNLDGIQAYLNKINREGGVGGRKIRLRVKDCSNKGIQAITDVRDLNEIDHVFALVAPFGTPFMVASRSYINKNAIPVIAPNEADGRSRTPLNPTIFWIRASFDQEVEATLDMIKEVYKTDEFAFYRPHNAIGESMILQYVKWAHEKKMKIIATGEEGDQLGDVAGAVKTIAAAHPKVVVLGGNVPSNIPFLKAAMEAGLKADWVVNSPGMAAEFYNGFGRTVGTVIMSEGVTMDEKDPVFKEYAAEMKKTHHEVEAYSFQGYAAGVLLAEAIKRAGHDLTRPKLVGALNAMHEIKIVGMDISYSATEHGGPKRISFYRLMKEGYVPLSEKNGAPSSLQTAGSL